MNLINDGTYKVKRLDLIPNYPNNPTAIDYFVDILTPEGEKLTRVDIIQTSDGIDDDTGKNIYKVGYTTKIIYQAYASSNEDVQFPHIESDSDTFLGFPHKVIVEVLPGGGTTSKVSEIAD